MAEPADIVSAIFIMATGAAILIVLNQGLYGDDLTPTLKTISSLAPVFVFFLIILFFGLTILQLFEG